MQYKGDRTMADVKYETSEAPDRAEAQDHQTRK